jgi:hypothetical protein
MIEEGAIFFPFYFQHFNLESFSFCHFVLFCFVSNSNKPFNVCSSKKILLLVVDVFWCSSSGDALTFAHSGSSSHCIVFLATLGTMCHLSLGVWTNTMPIFLFVYLRVLFCFCLYIKNFILLLCC